MKNQNLTHRPTLQTSKKFRLTLTPYLQACQSVKQNNDTLEECDVTHCRFQEGLIISVLFLRLLSCPPFVSNSRCGPTYPAPRSPVSSVTSCSVGLGSWRNSSWRKSATWRRRRACCPTPQPPTGWRPRARWTPWWRGSASWRKVMHLQQCQSHSHHHNCIRMKSRWNIWG